MASSAYIKPIATGVAAALDRFVLNNVDNTSMAYFGGAVTAGVFASTLFSAYLPDMSSVVSDTAYYKSKEVEKRILEVAFGTGASYAINTYILKNTNYYDDIYKRLGVIVAADFIGEYISDYMTGEPLQYLI